MNAESTGPVAARLRFVLGTMTGTSIDGDLDAAAVAVRGSGLAMRAEVIAHGSWPLGEVAADLRRIAAQEPMAAGEFARIARAFGERHAAALDELWCRARVGLRDAASAPDLAVVHGQTVFHAPPLTFQLIDPWPVANRLRCKVRYDLRGASVSCGGEGAPITPLADLVLFGREDAAVVVLNLGGFVNATFVPPRAAGAPAIRGFDVCACNHLLDRVARTRLGTAFDRDGAAALRGTSNDALATRISEAIAPAIGSVRQRRSLGTGDEAVRLVDETAHLAAEDACATVTEAIADAIARTLRAEFARHGPSDDSETVSAVLVAGGSARHAALKDALRRKSGIAVLGIDDAVGMPVEVREAAGMAVLGALAEDGVRYALPQVVGTASTSLDSAVVSGEI